MAQRVGLRRGLIGVAVLALAGLLVVAAHAAPNERPGDEVTAYLPDLRKADTLARQAASSAVWVGSRNAKGCAQFGPAASKLAAAAAAAQAIFQRYQQAKSRYGTLEEIQRVNTLKQALAEARGNLAKAAGESAAPSAAEVRAARAEIGAFRQVVAGYAEGRLGIEGLADVLTGKGFRTMKNSVVTRIQTTLRTKAEAELRRLVGFRIRLDVPLRQQIHDFMETQLSRLASKLAISAGPAGIVVVFLGRKIVNFFGAALDRILRHGNVEGRANRSINGLDKLQRRLNLLPRNAPVDTARTLIRKAERELGRTSFIEADLKRTGKTDLLDKLILVKELLDKTVKRSKHRFLVDSELLRENFAADAALAAAAAADAQRLAAKLGCTITTPPAPSPPSAGGAGTPPTAAVCVPGSIRMEYSNMFGVKLGEYDASFQKLVPGGEYAATCLWTTPSGPTDEAFVVRIEWIPDGVQGALASGASTGRQDSPPWYHSRKRYLTVSGGPRKYYQEAVAGSETILKGVLAAAEAAGVGKACS